MTREQMAKRLQSLSGFAHSDHGDVLSAAATELRRTCEWTEDSDGIYHTACKHAFYFDGGSATGTENQFKFCGYCGWQLVERPYIEPVEAG